MEMGTKSII